MSDQLTAEQRQFKRAILRQLAGSISDFVELNGIDGPRNAKDRAEVITELGNEFARRAAGVWRRPR